MNKRGRTRTALGLVKSPGGKKWIRPSIRLEGCSRKYSCRLWGVLRKKKVWSGETKMRCCCNSVGRRILRTAYKASRPWSAKFGSGAKKDTREQTAANGCEIKTPKTKQHPPRVNANGIVTKRRRWLQMGALTAPRSADSVEATKQVQKKGGNYVSIQNPPRALQVNGIGVYFSEEKFGGSDTHSKMINDCASFETSGSRMWRC